MDSSNKTLAQSNPLPWSDALAAFLAGAAAFGSPTMEALRQINISQPLGSPADVMLAAEKTTARLEAENREMGDTMRHYGPTRDAEVIRFGRGRSWIRLRRADGSWLVEVGYYANHWGCQSAAGRAGAAASAESRWVAAVSTMRRRGHTAPCAWYKLPPPSTRA